MTKAVPKHPVVVSACLLGHNCRYDGMNRMDPALLKFLEGVKVIAVCPETLGGLPTPRPKAALEGGAGTDALNGNAKVRTVREKRDVTACFLRGARQALAQAREGGARKAFLKTRSPSCGVGRVHTLGGLAPGDGVFTALLRREGFDLVAVDGGERSAGANIEGTE